MTMKLIVKSIFAHRAQSAALFVEIMIVTVIGWIVLEPVAIETSIALIPSNYDYDRLVSIKINTLGKSSEKYDPEACSDKDAFYRLLDMIRSHPEVERATLSAYQSFESGSRAMSGFLTDSAYNLDADNNGIGTNMIQYVPSTDYFATYGIKTPDGKPFKEPVATENSFIVSETLAKARYAKENPIGRNLYSYDPTADDEHPTPIVGIIADTPYRKGEGRIPVAFRIITEEMLGWYVEGLTVRLKEGVNPRVFVDNLLNDIDHYRAGNKYLTHPILLSDKRKEVSADTDRQLTQKWIILAFFLVNVVLGVAGTFYIQCRTRTADSGVMRAFGATGSDIRRSIIGEACSIVTTAWLAGSLLYIAYLHIASVEFEYDTMRIVEILNPMWYDAEWSRLSIIGGLVLILLIIATLLGVWLPARKISSVNPVDALRDE